MPYYLHESTQLAIDGREFENRAEAYAELAAADHGSEVTFLPSYLETATWTARENVRFEDGVYRPVPWSQYRGELAYRHFAHVSRRNPALVAFTLNAEHGVSDRHTQQKPGRYLQEYYPDLTDQQRADYVVSFGMVVQPPELHITSDPDEIEKVYRNGPSSCMSDENGGDVHRFEGLTEHPSRAYGGPGSCLAVAYHGDMQHASSRCVVWPERKLYSRIYGGSGCGTTNTLKQLLVQAGYEQGSMNGATIRLIENKGYAGGYCVPYVDYCDNGQINPTDKYITLGEGRLALQNVSGIASADRDDEDEDEDDDNTFYCEGCDERVSDDDYYGNGECTSCYRARTVECETCPTRVDTNQDHDYFMVDDVLYCEHCFARDGHTCDGPSCDMQFMSSSFSRSERAVREADGTEGLCSDCHDIYTWCNVCNDYVERSVPLASTTDDNGCLIPSESVIEPSPYAAACSECQRVLAVPEGQLSFMPGPFDTWIVGGSL